MKQFYKKVDMRSRSAMIDFLTGHFRYCTANSWNGSTSYANNIKIHKLEFPASLEDKLYELIELTEFYERLEPLINDFGMKHDYRWQVGFNGRSGGYLVLYQGYCKPSEYKSYCLDCGQNNFKTVEETGNCRCGRCGRDSRVNYTRTPLELGVYPGKATDMNEDFLEWDTDMLKERVRLVQEFDLLCDNLIALAQQLAENYEIEDEIVYRPVRVRRMREVAV